MSTTGSSIIHDSNHGKRLALLAVGLLCLTNSVISAAPTINSPAVAPSSIPVNSATAVIFTASITDPSITTTGINLQRLDANGNTFSNAGAMYDDGSHGDAVAGDQTFSLQLTLAEPSPFPVTFRISAPVKGSLTRIFSNLITLNVAGAAPAVITLTSPPSLAFVNSSPVTVSGTVSDSTATVTVNGLQAPVSGGGFTVSVPIQEGNNTLTASAKNSQGTISTASLQVTLDTTPPRISIDAPFDGFSTTDSFITVSGKANDTVVGTVNNQQVTVTVNDLNATVANRAFVALNVPLTLGNNSIVVAAHDRAGNGATAQITVRRDNPTQSVIKIISGNNQTGAAGAQLSLPIVAGVADGAGNPVSGQIVVFTVTQNNGSLDSAAAVEAVTTNSAGQAQARWKLGTRSGAGNNIVEATAVGFAGSAIFTATGTPGNAAQVSLDAGNDQIGAVSQPLPHPFIVVITDSSHNRLSNVPVTFQVKQGGGNFGGQVSITTNTDSDGRAAAVLTLGPADGIENNVAEATFLGNSGFPAAFSASGHVPGNPAATKITGVVLDNSNNPVPGATIRAYLQNVPAQQSGGLPPNVTAQSDLQGQFNIQPAPVGFVKIIADGSTVQRPGKWPNLEYDLVTVSGQNNTIGLPIYLLPLDTQHQLCVSDTQGGTLTIPSIPGFSLSVLPGAATFPGGSKSGCVTVTAVHPDKIPMVPGFGQQPRFIVTVQPAGTLFNPPASVSIPNAEGLAPREVTEMYSFDHDLDTFVSIGSATVSDDGMVIRSDPGVGIVKAGWYCGGPPTPAGSVGVCGDCKTCAGSSCVKDPLQDGNVCSTSSNAPGICSDSAGNCIPINVTISRIQSDQISGVLANYLPGGTGDPAASKSYILMGTRGGTIYVKGQLTLTPDTSQVRALLMARFSSGGTFVGSSTVDSNDLVSVSAPEPSATTDYSLVVGVDRNQNGQLDPGEELATKGIFKVVPSSSYTAARLTAIGGGFFSGIVVPIATDFVTKFATGSAPAGSTAGSPLTISINTPGHTHNVGANWGGSPPTASIPVYDFSTTSSVSDAVLNSSTLSGSANLGPISCLNSTFNARKAEVQAKFVSDPSATSETFTWPILCPSGAGNISFEKLNDLDLWAVIHGAGFSGTVTITVQKSILGLLEGAVSVQATITDLYDFDYDGAFPSVLGATLEAGFPTPGPGGQVFKEVIQVSGSPARLVPFAF